MLNSFASRVIHGALLLLACAVCPPVYAQEGWSVHFYGYLKHVNRPPGYREGGMDYFGVSKGASYEAFQFDSGANAFIDSFGKRSFTVYSDVSHDNFRYEMFTPMVRLACMKKGKGINTDEMETTCFPAPKIRIGARTGLFADVTLVPKIEGFAAAMGMVEFGYKW